MGVLSFVMYGVNCLFWMMGASMLGVGIWMAVDDSDAREAFAVAGLNEDLYWTSVYFMIATGALIFIVAFLGMLGACKPKSARWALYAYIGIIGFVMIVQLNIIILTGIFWDSLDSGIEENMSSNLKLCYVNETSNDEVSKSWNSMQTDFKCCGGTDYMDYKGSVYDDNSVEYTVPWTCCVMSSEKEDYVISDVKNITQCRLEGNADNTASSSALYLQGCYPAVKDHLEEHSAILIALTCTFAVLEISGIVLAFLLARGGDD